MKSVKAFARVMGTTKGNRERCGNRVRKCTPGEYGFSWFFDEKPGGRPTEKECENMMDSLEKFARRQHHTRLESDVTLRGTCSFVTVFTVSDAYLLP